MAKIIRASAFEQKKKTGFKFNAALALNGLWTSGPNNLSPTPSFSGPLKRLLQNYGLQCRHFHRARANGFDRESAMLKLLKRGGNGASQGEGGRGERRENALPSPFPLSFFGPHTYAKGYYFYSP